MDILFRVYRLFIKQWYRIFYAMDRTGMVTLMNYGYVNGKKLSLPASEENYRTGIQMYNHVASGEPLKGKIVLEIGSGRGGGAIWLTKRYLPKQYIGLDTSAEAVTFSRKTSVKIKNIHFSVGDAQRIPFDDQSFDVVINIESSHCYPHPQLFYREAYRVIKPGGYFLCTDYRPTNNIETWIDQLKSAGFKVKIKENITDNVLRALDKDHLYKINMITRHVPFIFRYLVREFVGVRGSAIYEYFKNNKKQYWNFVLKKL